MSSRAVLRSEEASVVTDFLAAASIAPTGLLLEGEAGIGKTTLWLTAVDQARDRGFRVLPARAAQAESVLAYGSAADLLVDVDPSVWADLPVPQRLALNRLLFRDEDVPTNPGTVAAAFVSVISELVDDSPVLIAIDDLQWLDTSSKSVVGYIARRISGRVGILATVRTADVSADSGAWLQLPRPETLTRVGLLPLSMGRLQAVMSDRLGRTFSRPTMARIQEISGGNPFYAIELGRAIVDHAADVDTPLPGTLSELVQTRIGNLGRDVRDALLATACVAAPTVDLIGSAINRDSMRATELLETAESNGIVTLDGHRVRFVHPLLAHGVYTNAPAALRREMHKRLADIVDEPELHARHLALGSTSGDSETLQALDVGAQAARLRGAPAAAAELIQLAFALGGDTPERRIQLAGDHFGAGDGQSARALLEETVETMTPGPFRAVVLSLLALARAFDDSFTESVGLWERALADAGDNLALRVPALVILSQTLFTTGQLAATMQTAQEAVSAAERLGDPLLLSQAIGISVVVRFTRGDGLDEPGLQRALELEKSADECSSPSGLGSQALVRASMQKALLLGWTGQLEDAHRQLAAMRQRCIDNGEEHELMYVTHQSVQVEIWRGDFVEAAAIADIGKERGMLPRGDVGLGATLTERAAFAAYAGIEEKARHDALAGAAAFQRCGTVTLADWPIGVLGFLEVSLGNYEAALTILQPLLSRFEEAPDGTEIVAAEFLPDAIEAMIQLGRLDGAEPLIAMLERNGQRLDRPWMLTVAARCRALLLAAQGDIVAASEAAEAAMGEHERLPMPFERARTQLLVGQLQRRLGQPNAAAAALRDALAAFESMGVPLWANRARDELARADVARIGGMQLTPSEQRVAELAGSGMTNRDVAAALFISPKTVEANLGRIYRKLGIRSRAELGRRMGQPDA